MFRPLSTEAFATPQSELAPGPAPVLLWIEIQNFVVDTEYQREIGKRGRQNIRLIAENFDWSKFAPIIVAPIEGGLYAIVDGQHRTTAAMIRGFEKVPCQIWASYVVARWRAANSSSSDMAPTGLPAGRALPAPWRRRNRSSSLRSERPAIYGISPLRRSSASISSSVGPLVAGGGATEAPPCPAITRARCMPR